MTCTFDPGIPTGQILVVLASLAGAAIFGFMAWGLWNDADARHRRIGAVCWSVMSATYLVAAVVSLVNP